jgi:ABC-type nitrate/sulfonate/bicarbonate transport system permease component
MKKLDRKRFLQSTAAVMIFVGFWHLASVTGLFGRVAAEFSLLLLPTPVTVFKTVVEMILSGYLWEHLSISLLRVAGGFLLAAVIAIPLGLGMALSQTFNSFTDPFIKIFSPIPGIAWVPLAILWFGLGDRAAIFIITIGSIFPIIMNTIQGVQDVDQHLVDASRMMGASSWQVLRRVFMPSLIPYLITGLRIGLGFAWRVVIAAEMVGVPKGIGYMLSVGRSTGRTDITIVTMVCLGVLMLLLERFIFVPLEKHTLFWRTPIKV